MAGCSFWPDSWLLGNLKQCCGFHDDLYSHGTTDADREWADNLLYECVKQTHSRAMALIMWVGVRAVGWLFFNYRNVGYEEVDVCPSDMNKSIAENHTG